ncbi:mads box protein, putative [Ricinus communis]|uniref:Mads box protein, putative n=1 Tax=Ricinus communis TaxID=3988 RepID=B9SZJ7_RICCO|nr:mads box protein, putative [Ricinus communis]
MAACQGNSPQETKKRGRAVLDGDKEARKQNFIRKILDDDKATKTASFYKRKPTLKKKAQELHTLCDVPVCVVCFGPNGSVDVWPEEEQCAKELMMSYKRSDKKERKESNVLELMQCKKKKLEKKKQEVKINALVSTLSKCLDGLSGIPLIDRVNELQDKLKIFKERIELLSMEKKRKRIETPDEEISPIVSILSSPKNQEFDNILLWPTSTSCSNLARPEGFDMAGTNNHSVVEDEVNSNVLLNNSNVLYGFQQIDPTVLDMSPGNLDMLENSDNYFVPFDHQHQISYIHDAMPISVWEPPQPLVHTVRSSGSSNVDSRNYFPAAGSTVR